MNYLNSKERNAVASLLLTVGVAEDILRSKNTTNEMLNMPIGEFIALFLRKTGK